MSQRKTGVVGVALGMAFGLTGILFADEAVPFRFVPAWEAAGFKLFQSRLLRFRADPPEKLIAEPEYQAPPRYAALELGPAEDGLLTCILVEPPDAEAMLYVDANNDNRIRASEKVRWREAVYPLRRGATEGWEAEVVFPVAEGKPTKRVRRTVLIVPGSREGTALVAWRGYWEGALALADGDYAARLVDGNGNGRFNESGVDRLWLDLNRDRAWDAAREQFVLQPALTVREQVYALHVAPGGEQVEARAKAGGAGRVQFVLGPSLAVSPQMLAATLISEEGGVFPVRDVSKPVEVPAGRYRLSAATLVLTERKQEWRYEFSAGETASFPLVVEPDRAQRIDLLGPLTLQLRVSGPAQPGATLVASVRVVSSTGLEVMNCTVGGSGGRAVQKAADLWLQDAAGQPLTRTRTGFT